MIDPLFHPSAIAVLKQVSGLPKSVRDRQQLLALQAFIDDSRSEGAILVLSGYIADAASWAKFSDEWQELLDGLRWDEFKMARLALGGGDETCFARFRWASRQRLSPPWQRRHPRA
jgi:hypothetical protein